MGSVFSCCSSAPDQGKGQVAPAVQPTIAAPAHEEPAETLAHDASELLEVPPQPPKLPVANGRYMLVIDDDQDPVSSRRPFVRIRVPRRSSLVRFSNYLRDLDRNTPPDQLVLEWSEVPSALYSTTVDVAIKIADDAAQYIDDINSAIVTAWHSLATAVHPTEKDAENLFLLAMRLDAPVLYITAAIYLNRDAAVYDGPQGMLPAYNDGASLLTGRGLQELVQRIPVLQADMAQFDPPLSLRALDMLCLAGALHLVCESISLHTWDNVVPRLPKAFLKAIEGRHLRVMKYLVDVCERDHSVLRDMVTAGWPPCTGHSAMRYLAEHCTGRSGDGFARDATRLLIDCYRKVDGLEGMQTHKSHAILRASARHGATDVLQELLGAYQWGLPATTSLGAVGLEAGSHECLYHASRRSDSTMIQLLLVRYKRPGFEDVLRRGLKAKQHRAIRAAACLALLGPTDTFQQLLGAYQHADPSNRLLAEVIAMSDDVREGGVPVNPDPVSITANALV